MKLSPRDRLIATIAGCVLLLLVLAAILIYPQIQKMSALNAQVAQAEASAQAAKMKLDAREGFRDRAIANNAKWLRLMNQVPDTPDLASLIIELQDTAFNSGVQLVAMSPAAPSAQTGFSSIPVAVTVLGSWADTIDYMQALMKLDRGVRVLNSATNLTSNVNTTEVRNSSLPKYPVQTILGLETYMIPSSATTAAPPATAPAQ